MSEDIVQTTANIPLNLIVKSSVALRDVDEGSEKFIQLVQSIAQRGVLNSITVREVRNTQTGTVTYGLVDGLQRFTAAQKAGLTSIPANIISLNEAELLEAQIIANLHKIETKPAEYTQQLLRILSENPLLTIRELANRLCQQEAWLIQRLSLGKLTPDIQALVDEGKIALSNAYALAKLPQEEQVKFVDKAITDSSKEFLPAIRQRATELRAAARQGKDPNVKTEFQPVPFLQKISDIKTQIENPQLAAIICEIEGVSAPVDCFVAALKWCLHLDKNSVKEQIARNDEREKKREDEKARAKAERAEKLAREAAEKAVSLESLR